MKYGIKECSIMTRDMELAESYVQATRATLVSTKKGKDTDKRLNTLTRL